MCDACHAGTEYKAIRATGTTPKTRPKVTLCEVLIPGLLSNLGFGGQRPNLDSKGPGGLLFVIPGLLFASTLRALLASVLGLLFTSAIIVANHAAPSTHGRSAHAR